MLRGLINHKDISNLNVYDTTTSKCMECILIEGKGEIDIATFIVDISYTSHGKWCKRR